MAEETSEFGTETAYDDHGGSVKACDSISLNFS